MTISDYDIYYVETKRLNWLNAAEDFSAFLKSLSVCGNWTQDNEKDVQYLRDRLDSSLHEYVESMKNLHSVLKEPNK